MNSLIHNYHLAISHIPPHSLWTYPNILHKWSQSRCSGDTSIVVYKWIVWFWQSEPTNKYSCLFLSPLAWICLFVNWFQLLSSICNPASPHGQTHGLISYTEKACEWIGCSNPDVPPLTWSIPYSAEEYKTSSVLNNIIVTCQIQQCSDEIITAFSHLLTVLVRVHSKGLCRSRLCATETKTRKNVKSKAMNFKV